MNDLRDKGYSSRGLRNNNPGNIRISKSAWRGKVKNNTDGAFEQFTHVEYGIRAFFILCRNYKKKYGVDTIMKFCAKYAPSNENNTLAYATHIQNQTNISFNSKIDLENHFFLIQLAKAVFNIENHQSEKNTITQEMILGGLSLATGGKSTINEVATGVMTEKVSKATDYFTICLLVVLGILIVKI